MTVDAFAERNALDVVEANVALSASLPDQVFRVQIVRCWFFDFDFIWTADFFEIVQQMTANIGEEQLIVAVTRPDPVAYFQAHFGRLPVRIFRSSGDSPATYLCEMHEDPGDSPADAMVHNADIVVVAPDRPRWMIYGDRSLELGLLATTDEQTAAIVKNTWPPTMLFSPADATERLLPITFGGSAPADIRSDLLKNYASPSQ